MVAVGSTVDQVSNVISYCHENLCPVQCCIYWCHFWKFTLYLYDLSSITSTLVQIRPLFVYILSLPL